MSMTKRDEILAAAEGMIRVAGYNAFSTRDVGAAVGIKAASVHYHFPTKASLGTAVTDRYTQRFIEGLGEPGRFQGKPREAFRHYASAFREALSRDGKLCLCAVLGAEAGGLPPDVGESASVFFRKNLAWLTSALTVEADHEPGATASRVALILAALEGAMIVAKSLDDNATFERVVQALERTLFTR